MAYNKARAEKEWLKWKNEEEAKLRELGVLAGPALASLGR